MDAHLNSAMPIRERLIEAMRTGEYANQQRLPPESVLAESFGISRTQLRDILSLLEREGIITRRHGVGTIINRHVLDARTRMDLEVEFLDMIRMNGYRADVAFVRIFEDEADETVAARLNIAEGAPVLRIVRLCTADDRPAIYCEDLIDKRLARGEYTIQDLKLPIFHFLKDFCDVDPYMDLADIRPVVADEGLSGIFQVPPGAPLLNIDEVDYDINGKPVLFSKEYFADGIFRHTVMRKKL